MPIEGADFEIYGGATSCFRVSTGAEEIFLDAGSGIVGAEPDRNCRITILLTHMHLDHITGLPFFPPLMQAARAIEIYACPRGGFRPEAAFERLISPPIWPLKVTDYPSDVKLHVLSETSAGERGETFSIGDVLIETMEGVHPSGSTIYKLTRNGRSIVYATDFEHSRDDVCAALITFASDCELLLFDAQYTDQEYERCRGFGHSTARVGFEIASRARVKRLMFVHHAPNRTDRELAAMEKEFVGSSIETTFAKLGDEIFI